MNDMNQAQQNVDSDQVSTQDVTPASQQVPSANDTPLYDGLQQPKGPDDEDEASVASHNVFQQDAVAGDTDNVYAVDGDDPASIEAALQKHHEAHGA